MSVCAELCSEVNRLPIQVEDTRLPLRFQLEATVTTVLDNNDSDYKSENTGSEQELPQRML